MIQKTTAADGSPPYAAVCYFRRQGGNYLESGEVRGNMRMMVFHTQNGAVLAKPMKIFCRLAINQIETILNSKERIGILYVNGGYK